VVLQSRAFRREPCWKNFFEGYDEVHTWLDRVKSDVAVMIFNDLSLNFFLDNLPTFAVGAANEYQREDEGRGYLPFYSTQVHLNFPGI